jgi:hypothetical protein
MEQSPPSQTIAAVYILVLTGILVIESIAQITQSSLALKTKTSSAYPTAQSTMSCLGWKRFQLEQKRGILPSNAAILLTVFSLLNFAFFILPSAITKDWNLDTLANNAAWVGTGNCFFILILATRNSIFRHLINMPFERTISLHAWLGWAIALEMTLHTVLHFVNWATYRQLQIQMTESSNIYGTISWVCLVILSMTSIKPIRRKMFRVFYYAHYLFIPFIVFACLHVTYFTWFILGGVVLWAIDRAIRFVRSRQHVELLDVQTFSGPEAMDESLKTFTSATTNGEDFATAAAQTSGLVKLTVKLHKNHSYEAGQYLFLCVPKVANSWLLDWHPMTVSSAPSGQVQSSTLSNSTPASPFASTVELLESSESKTLTLHIKGSGDFSRKLYSAASGLDAISSEELCNSLKAFQGTSVDGYYGLSKLHWCNYSTVALVSGGVGFTAMHSIGADIVNRMLLPTEQGTMAYCTKTLYMIQYVRTWPEYMYFRAECRAIWEALPLVRRNNCKVVLKVFITKPSGFAPPLEEVERRNIFIAKPTVSELFQDVKERSDADVAVGVCGPSALVRDVRNACVKVMEPGHAFDLHYETFDF